MDEKGYLKQSHKNKLFGHAYVFYHNGDMPAAKLAFEKYCGIPKSKQAIEKLQNIASCAQIEFCYGNLNLGLFLLTIIAGIERQFSPIDDIVLDVKTILNSHLQID